jgi:ribonuclease HI
LRVDLLHPDYIELAPENWYETRELTARFRYLRPDLAAPDVVPHDVFRSLLDLTMPVFIETDGACAGNPGPGGWGFIIAQCNMKIEACGAEGHTTNNEMELRAIDEALGFFGNARGYAVIESDSQGCLDVMMGRGDQWEADNYIRLDGSLVKNRELVQNITAKLRSFNVQFRKVEGHSGDQWNDAVDAFAVRGRDEAATWPKCTFDVVTPALNRIQREGIEGNRTTCESPYGIQIGDGRKVANILRREAIQKRSGTYRQLGFRALPVHSQITAATIANFRTKTGRASIETSNLWGLGRKVLQIHKAI